MPLFFLHLWDGVRLIRDPDGSFHDHLEGARNEAIESARELMAAGILDEGRIGIERTITICDASGTALLVLPFREAMDLNSPVLEPLEPLHEQVLRYPDVQSVLAWLLQRGLEVCQSSHGNIQLMNWAGGYLEIKAQQGFQDEFLNFFARVNLSDGSACARALRHRQSIIVENIMVDQHFAACREIISRAGIRAVQSTPLLSSGGALVGIISIHFASNHRPEDQQIRAMNNAAETAANAIVRLRAQASDGLRASFKILGEGRDVIARANKLLERRQ